MEIRLSGGNYGGEIIEGTYIIGDEIKIKDHRYKVIALDYAVFVEDEDLTD